MKATKDEIIEIALQILERYEPLNRSSIVVREEKVPIYIGSNKYYYKHNGWFFMINGIQVYDIGPDKISDSFLLYFLEDGTCIRLSIANAEGGSGIKTCMIYKEGVGYKWVSIKDFIAHHNFDFNDPKFEKVLH
ncbi:hypothetical protein U8527_00580 [Kordia algicida OT-1]|uniref:Uncharacterized protein n=1 Tax=Kordia algicida OT-1 TaxID=391587 RepID=A9DRF5_9FLAO|nr:hypothetical protein [Kordia algicida]EDP96786.1 hypothetical protein KAOT1_16523 [Kordia algicida OT-1]